MRRRSRYTSTRYALSRLPRRSQPPPIDFTSVPLAIYHSDISMGNFLLDPATQRVWLINFEHVGAFSLPFRAFALYNTGSAFAVAGCGDAARRRAGKTLTSIVHAANSLRMCGDESLGLGGDGSVRVRPKRKQRVGTAEAMKGE
ncbi:hypothetical protein DFH08DRAFT_337999 [Mycena albidolilacea]|uniref:Uncharacterized protein n=1 Tax=Mycena albidolilacea TaxID=1033008 RepID=A0AAD6ZKJ6_9AGAR|nr:hypothetical protein DFH08DRAFT_337999 [Mycena albidolilacea]